MHYYTYPEKSGGPLTYIKTICSSELKNKYSFDVCYQMKPISKIGVKDIKRMISEVKNFKPDIFHIHGLQSEGFVGTIIGKMSNCNCILMTVHGLQQDALNIGKIKKVFFRYILEPITLSISDAVYCVCKETHNRQIIQKYSKKLYPFIYNSVSNNLLEEEDKSYLRTRLGISHEVILIIIVGRVSLDKGMLTLERVIINDSNDRLKYLIIGDGDYAEQMKINLSEHIKRRKVIFTGQQSDVAKYLRIADIYLSVSLHENLSISIIEACLAKLPCVVTKIGGNVEIIIDNFNGYTVAPNNYTETLTCLQKLALSLHERESMGQESYNIVRNKFSESLFVKRIDSLYSELLLK